MIKINVHSLIQDNEHTQYLLARDYINVLQFNQKPNHMKLEEIMKLMPN